MDDTCRLTGDSTAYFERRRLLEVVGSHKGSSGPDAQLRCFNVSCGWISAAIERCASTVSKMHHQRSGDNQPSHVS